MEIMMLSVRLPKELEYNLSEIAKQLKSDKSKVVIDALSQYIEDKQDYLSAHTVFVQNNKRYTFEEVLNELKLQD
jgi:predicted DNA-binding protein